MNETNFEIIKHRNEYGDEFWYARELQKMLGYKEWRLFSAIIEKAKLTCSQSNNKINDHFEAYSKIVKAGVTTKPILDYRLSRYACYLIVQKANPKSEAVALGKKYFFVQTKNEV